MRQSKGKIEEYGHAGRESSQERAPISDKMHLDFVLLKAGEEGPTPTNNR